MATSGYAHIDSATGKVPSSEIDGSVYEAAGAAATAQANAIAASDPVGSSAAVLASSLQKASNLSDVVSASTARSNLQIQSGTDVLVAGTVTIVATITANSRILVTIKDANPGIGNLTIGLAVPSASRVVGSPGSFDVRANIADGTINVLDTSTFDWIIIG